MYKFVVVCALAFLVGTRAARAEDADGKLSKLNLEIKGKDILVTLEGNRPPDFTGFAEKSPDRVVVDWSGVSIADSAKNLEYPQGLVRRVFASPSEESEPGVRVTIELRKATTFKLETLKNGILVRLVNVDVPVEPAEETKPKPVEKPAPKADVAEPPPEGPLTESTDLPPPPTEPKIEEPPPPPEVAVAPPPPAKPFVPPPLPPEPKKVDPSNVVAPAPVPVPPEPENRKTLAKWTPPKKGIEAKGSYVLSYVGFRQKSDVSEVFVRLSGDAEYHLEQKGHKVVVELPRTQVNVRNNERELDTSFFDSPVTRVQAISHAEGTRIEIDLRAQVAPKVVRIGTTLAFDFPAQPTEE